MSSEPLHVNFHPSCLLTLGDTLAILREMTATQQHPVGESPSSRLTPEESGSAQDTPAEASAEDDAHSHSDKHADDVAVTRCDNPPSMDDQMAAKGSITSRVPQRWDNG